MLNPIHEKIITHIRTKLQDKKSEKIDEFLALDDLVITRNMFANFRFDGNITSGIRLNSVGSKVLCNFFDYYTSEITTLSTSFSKLLIFLENTCTMPYFIDENKVIMFESELGSMLVLSGGNMDTLLDIYI